MGNDVVESKTFEERMLDRVKQNAESLMTDDELKKIIEKSMEATFFNERKDRSRAAGYHSYTLDPLAHEMCLKAYNNQVREIVENWLQENPEVFKDKINEVFEEQIGITIMKAFSGMFQNQLYSFQDNIIQEVNQRFSG